MLGAELYVGLFSIFFSPSFEQVHYRSSSHLEKHSHLKIAISTILLTFVSFLLKYYPIMRSIWMIDLFIRGASPVAVPPFRSLFKFMNNLEKLQILYLSKYFSVSFMEVPNFLCI